MRLGLIWQLFRRSAHIQKKRMVMTVAAIAWGTLQISAPQASAQAVLVGRPLVSVSADRAPYVTLGQSATVTVNVPPGFESGQSLVFAISLEPSGGSPTEVPSGPVLDRAEQNNAI